MEAGPGTSCKEKTGAGLEGKSIDIHEQDEQACGILPGDLGVAL